MSRAFSTLAVALALNVAGDALPTEFRLFTKGWNETENGRYLFDEQAAASVIAAHEQWGVDLMIDLEHQSLDEKPSPDPTAKDARGWCRLELRDDGSLWAVNVTWTPDGAERLREKRQRYVSPAFGVDRESGRIMNILNVAITAMPATHDTPALVAARVRPMPRDLRKLAVGFSFSDISRALDVALAERFPPRDDAASSICRPSGPWIHDVFDASLVFELEGKLYEAAYTFDGAKATLAAPVEVRRSYAPATAPPVAANKRTATKLALGGNGMDPKLIAAALEALIKGDSKKCEEILKGMVVSAAGGEPAAGDKPASPPAPQENTAAPAGEGTPAAEDEEKKKEPMLAAARVLCSLTGKANPGEAVAELVRLHTIATEMEKREKALSADRAALELTERRSLVAELVRLGVEIPATAWKDPLQGKDPVARLTAEPIGDLRNRVQALNTARGARPSAAPTPPPGPTPTATIEVAKEFVTSRGVVVTLSARELRACADMKCKPEEYAENKAVHLSAIPS